MELTWHGHSTWSVELNGTTFLIDPFFDNPKTSLTPDKVDSPDFLVITHGHADHIADAAAFSDATAVSTPEITGYLEAEHGFSDSIGMNIGGTIAVGDAFLTMVRADHTNGLMTGYEHEVGMPTGVVISETRPGRDGCGTSFYHAGDTGLMSEMKDVIGAFIQPTVAALPVGDHFTMGPVQAAIATGWLGVDHVLPMHYDTFPPVEIDIDDFVDEVEATTEATPHVLAGDESVTID